MVAKIDPLGMPRPHLPELDPEYYGFTDGGHGPAVFDRHDSRPRRADAAARLSSGCATPTAARSACSSCTSTISASANGCRSGWRRPRTASRSPSKEQLRILTRLTDAVIFEEFIQKKFIGAKSFSLEGAESLIPLLDLAIEKAGDQGIHEIVHGHGPPRPAQRAGQHHGQEPAGDLPRVRRHRSQAAPGPRRREVPPRLQQRLDHRRAAQGPPLAVLQSQPPGVRQSRWPMGRTRAKQDRSGDIAARARHGAADPRRRGLRRRRRRAGDAQPQPA